MKKSLEPTQKFLHKVAHIKQVEIIVVALTTPVLVGIYENGNLIQKFVSDENEKAGDFLISKFDEILQIYEIKSVIYANTPGSFMGIKLSYVILKTLSTALNFPLFAISGFELNNFSPIRANKNLSFVYHDGEIVLEKCEPKAFELPQTLSNLNKNSDILPNYIIGAV